VPGEAAVGGAGAPQVPDSASAPARFSDKADSVPGEAAVGGAGAPQVPDSASAPARFSDKADSVPGEAAVGGAGAPQVPDSASAPNRFSDKADSVPGEAAVGGAGGPVHSGTTEADAQIPKIISTPADPSLEKLGNEYDVTGGTIAPTDTHFGAKDAPDPDIKVRVEGGDLTSDA
jgi:hypothetical protein